MKVIRKVIAFIVLNFFIAVSLHSAEKPNIVLIMCDDLGYGDVQILNPDHGKIRTPHMDSIAKEGMTFSDAHSGSSVCTPTRYGLLTGRYSWRTSLQKGVVQGFEPCLIAKDRPTIANFLKRQGYDSAIIGKWHLNCRYLDPKTGNDLNKRKLKATGPVGALIPDGPTARGFDFFHGIHHARSMKAIIENNKVIKHDDVINFLPRCMQQSVRYIESRKGNDRPFFLYVPLGAPHTPIVPTPKWKGKSGLGDYGDFVMQTDHVVGQILKTLKDNSFSQNTLLIFTSDNGCSKAAGIQDLASKGHRVSAKLRGSKADIWDGGHRVPFLVRWPKLVKKSTACDQTICLTDIFSTICEILGKPAPIKSCEDSISFLSALRGDRIKSERVGIVHHSFSGHFAIRQGIWKLALAKSSGGWSSPTEKQAKSTKVFAQLYDMSKDVGERQNLFASKPEIANRLIKQLEEYVSSGRSTPGPESPNDVPRQKIKLWKSGRPPSLN